MRKADAASAANKVKTIGLGQEHHEVAQVKNTEGSKLEPLISNARDLGPDAPPDNSSRRPAYPGKLLLAPRARLSQREPILGRPAPFHLASYVQGLLPGSIDDIKVGARSPEKLVSDEAPVVPRRKAAQPDPVSREETNDFDRLGNKVEEKTFKNVAAVVAGRAQNLKEFRPGDTVSTLIGWGVSRTLIAKFSGFPAHIQLILRLSQDDKELQKIAFMGVRVAMKNWRTGGIPPGGFEPLYRLMAKWGYNRQGKLVEPATFERRQKFMAKRAADTAEFREFSNSIGAWLDASERRFVDEATKETPGLPGMFLPDFP
jgi:hypothetical protein